MKAAEFEITIDNRTLRAREGETVLETALRHGIDIPNLCHNGQVTHTAACRLCIVKIAGRGGGIPSCTTAVEPGMEVTAFDDEIERIRRTTLDLALSNHNDDCISCVKDGDCQLQDLAFRYNLGRKDRLFPPIFEESKVASDFSSPILEYRASKCTQCNRCIKACREIQGKGVLSFANRGIATAVSTGHARWSDSNCDGCGQCVQICPTGALTGKQFYGDRKRVRISDIEKRVETTCPYCGVGCRLELAVRKDRIIKVRGALGAPNQGKTCVKGRFGLDFVDREDRLTTPLLRRDGELVEASWEEAIGYTAKKFAEIKLRGGAGALAGLSSARCTNEENFLFQKFIRSVIGTNNVDHCARLCHASTVAGLATTFGSGAMTNSIEEIERADVILVTGSNTTETHPVIATHIRRAVEKRKAKLIVVDPRRIDLVRHATLWLRQKSGSDVAWLNGMMHVILKEGLQNEAFIAEHTEEFAAFRETVDRYTPALVQGLSGIPADALARAARLFASAGKSTIIYSMGITQHSNGTDNVKSLANLALVTGHIGRESTGVNPLRGQNNVQGACDMGALPNVYPGYQKVTDPACRRKFADAWGKDLDPDAGLTVTEIVDGAARGDIRGLYIMGENPMLSDPDITHVKQGLQALDLLVVQDMFLTETAALADVVFPAASFAEKDGHFTNTERRILPVNQALTPRGESRSDWIILQELANAMGAGWEYGGIEDILDEINALVPQYGGITRARLEAGERLQWPCPTVDHPGTPYLHKEGFIRGKGLFSVIDHLGPVETPCSEYPLVMSTGRMLFHYHTGSMTRRTKALNAFCSEAYAEVSPTDCADLGVGPGEKVRVASRRGVIEIAVKETDKVAPGHIFIPFHFAEAAANMLTSKALDPVAKIPELKVCAVKISKIA